MVRILRGRVLTCLVAILLGPTAPFAPRHVCGADGPVLIQGGQCRVLLSPVDGSLAGIGQAGQEKPLLRSGDQGLWKIKFLDGSTLSASQFRSDRGERRLHCRHAPGSHRAELIFRAPEAVVVVTVAGTPAGVELVANVTPHDKVVLELALPGQLRFDPADLQRFISPLNPHLGIGAAWRRSFFQLQATEGPSAASPAASGPKGYLRYESPYPPLFADFFHLDAAGASLAVYRVQPRSWKPWEGRQTSDAIFLPGRLALGGEPQGGWCERAFATYVKPGQPWQTPPVRLTAGKPAQENLAEYCRANAVTRPLREKLKPDRFDKFRQAVLVKYNGTAREQIESLSHLPLPTLIHFTDYLKGGFDKEYPDHLPPHPRYGTPAELRALFDRAHALGHLMMPYTNPTWWCDHPRGPTFQREGEAPLLRGLDGKPSHERYGSNDGWTITMWHPAVQAANRATRRQFTEEYPVDILFQDQCGARTWKYDLNPASPTPYAYAEGMLSMVDEDSGVTPLSTEDGFDRVVNSQVQLCGFTFALVPGRNPLWARPMKSLYAPSLWELYPVAQIIAHDKAAMLHHDLGKFVVDRPSLAWTLGLGFSMSYVVRARSLAEPGPREWLRWLDRLQKSVCARYVGEPVRAFEHRQGTESADDGVIHATYGPVRLVANLGPKPRNESGRMLSGFGFYAVAPGVIAANLKQMAGADFADEGVAFVTEGDQRRADIWVYAAPGREVGAEVPSGVSGEVVVRLDGQPPQAATVRGGAIRWRLPEMPPGPPQPGRSSDRANHLWHAEVMIQ